MWKKMDKSQDLKFKCSNSIAISDEFLKYASTTLGILEKNDTHKHLCRRIYVHKTCNDCYYIFRAQISSPKQKTPDVPKRRVRAHTYMHRIVLYKSNISIFEIG